MVVLTAVVAAVYAVILIPFKPIPILPGVTELRPANAVPVLASLLFGPAAAWGAAFGNTIGDFFGTLGPGTLFGFVGNFLFGYVPYRVWAILGAGDPRPRADARWWTAFLVAVFLASLACGLFIGWGVELLGLAPFRVVAPLILLNNFLMAGILAPPLLRWIAPRVTRWGLTYGEILPATERAAARAPRLGLALLAAGLVLGYAAGFSGFTLLPAGAAAWEVSAAVSPFLLVSLAGLFLI